MTKYSIRHKDNLYIIEVSGHAGAATKGEDTVCASISTAIYMTRNFIEVSEPSYNLSGIMLDEGNALFSVSSEYEMATKALNVLEFVLDDLGNQFPQYIKKIN